MSAIVSSRQGTSRARKLPGLGAAALTLADPGWLERLITRRVPLERAGEAFAAEEGDVKVVVDLDQRSR